MKYIHYEYVYVYIYIYMYIYIYIYIHTYIYMYISNVIEYNDYQKCVFSYLANFLEGTFKRKKRKVLYTFNNNIRSIFKKTL